MAQLNMQIDHHFNEALTRFMRRRGILTRSEAIREAVRIALEAEDRDRNFEEWRGALADLPRRKSPRFESDDDLWR